jgi:predicted enzyme related to lactoylglutathione lyase
MSGKLTKRRVVGIRGIFFKATKPKKLSDWYRKHLGVKIEDNVALFTWRSRKNPKRLGYTVWSVFPQKSSYFGTRNVQFMINYRVKDLDGLLVQLRREKVPVDEKREDSKYGRFAWVSDPEGNRIELWEPPRSYRAPEEEMASE